MASTVCWRGRASQLPHTAVKICPFLHIIEVIQMRHLLFFTLLALDEPAYYACKEIEHCDIRSGNSLFFTEPGSYATATQVM